jgi:hypothetical protein
MNCPEHLVYMNRFISVWLYWHDVPRELIPLKVWANPLRYEVAFLRPGQRLFTINREGLWAGRVWWFFVKHKYEKAKRA